MQSWKDVLSQILFLVVFYGCLLVIGLCVATRLFGAPAPSYKPATIEVGVVYWEIRWGGVYGYASLERDGVFKCLYQSEQWIGTWAWDKNTNTLHVSERTPSRNYWTRWKVSLCDKLEGVVYIEGRSPEHIGTSFRIKKLSMR